MKSNSDWDKPFHERYLACADAMTRLDHWLQVIGMSGNDSFKRLQAEFIRHGGETFNDINSSPQDNAEPSNG